MYELVCSGKLPATVFIRMGPNLDTTCISEMSRGTFLEFSKFWIFTPFLLKKAFLRPKKEKIQDFFSDMPCDTSNQTTQPAQHFLTFLVQNMRFRLIWVVLTGLLVWPLQERASRRVCENPFLHFYFIYCDPIKMQLMPNFQRNIQRTLEKRADFQHSLNIRSMQVSTFVKIPPFHFMMAPVKKFFQIFRPKF